MALNTKAIESQLALIERLAARGKVHEMICVCESLTDQLAQYPNLTNRIGNLFLGIGYLSKAAHYFEKTLSLEPSNIAAQTGLAQVAHDAGQHREARQRYDDLLKRYPDNPVIQRNSLLSAEYDPELSDNERFQRALAWGKWVTQQNPPRETQIHPYDPDKPLKVGYVSADLCQHTVGLLVKDIITGHNPARVQTYVYNATRKSDWVTQEIRSKTEFRDVYHLDDDALEQLIRKDNIDLLVDLSGHTAGSRLSVFARKPAPVQISWLGYFATTGLKTIDAVLLDQWHVTQATQHFFTERIYTLPSRFYFSPLEFYPEISPPPSLKKGFITFGCFNNTAKITAETIKVWSAVMSQVPNSHLILKWRTFIDPKFREWTLNQFRQNSIDQQRVELRGASFHKEVLKQYADIDIALDPFPFTGGMSSLESLWMGVPIITLNGSRVVNRQTFAILSEIGYGCWSAQSREDYIQKSIGLATNITAIVAKRQSLRSKMKYSNLMQKEHITDHLEQIYVALAANIS